jgi:hypothetical protein
MVLLDLEALLAERVIDRLQLTNGRLEQIVRDAIDREISRLVGEHDDRDGVTNLTAPEDAQASESHGAVRDLTGRDGSPNGEQPPATKVCTSCGQEKPAGKFERHRNVCRACRWQAERERRDRTERQDDPFAGNGSTATDSRPAGHGVSSTGPSPS